MLEASFFAWLSNFDLCWPQMRFELHKIWHKSYSSKCNVPTKATSWGILLQFFFILLIFQTLISGDIRWPLISLNSTKIHLLTLDNLKLIYHVWVLPPSPSCDTIFTFCFFKVTASNNKDLYVMDYLCTDNKVQFFSLFEIPCLQAKA